MEKEYYIISNKHRNGDVIIFWKEDFCGYTKFRNSAGKYSLEEIREAKYTFPIYKSNIIYINSIDNFIIKETQVDDILYNCWKFK